RGRPPDRSARRGSGRGARPDHRPPRRSPHRSNLREPPPPGSRGAPRRRSRTAPRASCHEPAGRCRRCAPGSRTTAAPPDRPWPHYGSDVSQPAPTVDRATARRDLLTIYAVQALRALLYGFASVLVGASLAHAGYSDAKVGLVFTAMLAGFAVTSVAVGTRGDRVGRRRLYAGRFPGRPRRGGTGLLPPILPGRSSEPAVHAGVSCHRGGVHGAGHAAVAGRGGR